jgi:hypothetical protein
MLHPTRTADGTPVLDLVPAEAGHDKLTPTTTVLVINRGLETLVRKFNSLDFPLHPHTKGLMRMPYGAARHFQKHTVVPGTRNTATGIEQSYLGILYMEADPTQAPIDPPEMCVPFTPEECARFGQRVEAVERPDPAEVEMASVGAMVTAGHVPVRGTASQRGRKTEFAREGVTANGRKVARDAVMRADDDPNDAQREIAEAASEAAMADA